MTSRIIRDPMNVYSAVRRDKAHEKSDILLVKKTKKGGDTYLCLCSSPSLSLCLAVSLERGLEQVLFHSIHHWNSTG